MNVKNAPKPTLMRPMKVIITVIDGGATDNPIMIPITPVVKNIIIRTFTLVGSMYRICRIKIRHYYKLTVKQRDQDIEESTK